MVTGHHNDPDAGSLGLGDGILDALAHRILEGKEPKEFKVPVGLAAGPIT